MTARAPVTGRTDRDPKPDKTGRQIAAGGEVCPMGFDSALAAYRAATGTKISPSKFRKIYDKTIAGMADGSAVLTMKNRRAGSVPVDSMVGECVVSTMGGAA